MGILALIAVAGLLGPLLSMSRRLMIPIVAGEILGGVALGPSLLNLVHANSALVQLLHAAGFSVVMFTIGMHLPLRDVTLRRESCRAVLMVLATFAVGAGLGLLIGHFTDFGHPFVVSLLLANSSAALAVPVVRNDTATPDTATTRLIAWVMLADIAAVLLVPLATSSHPLLRVVGGTVLVVVAAVVFFLIQRQMISRGLWQRLHELSIERGWGWSLRINLALLFSLTWLATVSFTSALIAGFACGAVAAALGVTDHLVTEVIGVGEGFFIPVFFVTLGVSLDSRTLLESSTVDFAAVVVAGNIVVHAVGALVGRVGVARGLVASAQLGVPASIVTIGTSSHWMSASSASAIMASSMASIALCSLGSFQLGHSFRVHDRGMLHRVHQRPEDRTGEN